MADIVLKNICKTYKGGVEAVRDFTMEIHHGEFIVFVGPSGCGKSTTLRMIAGLEEISSGELYIDGVYANDLEPKDRDLAMVFQNYALYPYLNVYDNIAFGLRLRHYKKEKIDEMVRRTAKIYGLEELLDRKPKALSGGQRQRVALARAVVREAKAYLLDEPLSNLDAKLRSAMRVEITKLYKELNTTFIYVTHDQVEAMTMGTRIVVMKDGIVQQIDTPMNLYDHPVNVFVAGFIGTPQMNFFRGKIEKEGKNIALRFENGYALRLSKEKWKETVSSVLVGVRSEDILLSEEGCSVTVSMIEPLGSETLIHFVWEDDADYIMKIPGRSQCRIGDRIRISFRTEKVHIFDAETQKSILEYGEDQHEKNQ